MTLNAEEKELIHYHFCLIKLKDTRTNTITHRCIDRLLLPVHKREPVFVSVLERAPSAL